jgi:hypothetical protein
MDETTKIQRRTFGWPVILALIVLGLVLAYALFGGALNP